MNWSYFITLSAQMHNLPKTIYLCLSLVLVSEIIQKKKLKKNQFVFALFLCMFSLVFFFLHNIVLFSSG